MSLEVPRQFDYRYGPISIRYGPSCVSSLRDILAENSVERVMIVTGNNVGSNEEVMQPVRSGIGDRLVTVFDETTPKKDGEIALRGVERMRERSIDGIVVVGSGSSIDVARAMCVIEAEGNSKNLFSTHTPDGNINRPELPAEKISLFAVPTTFAGSEMTCASGVNFTTVRDGTLAKKSRSGPIYDPKILPTAIYYDPELYATTPKGVLAASGMNGFDHGLEMLYSRNANPITDAMASYGLAVLRESLPAAVNDPSNTEQVGRAINGVLLCSFGLVDPAAQANKYNIIHAFGHILSRFYDIQQGTVHGIVAPAVLQYIFTHADGRRELLADAMGVVGTTNGTETATAIVNSMREMRTALGLPDCLSDEILVERDHLSRLATEISQDVGVKNGPTGVPTDPDNFQEILEIVF